LCIPDVNIKRLTNLKIVAYTGNF